MAAPTKPLPHSFALAVTLVPALALGALGCNTTMPLAPDIAREMTAVPVTNRGAMTGSWADESFNLGPYRVANVDRRFTSSVGWNVKAPIDTGASSTAITGGHAYDFVAPGGQSRGECSVKLAEHREKVAGFTNDQDVSRVACRCTGGGLNSEVVLEGPDAGWQGQAMLHGFAIPMRAIDRYGNGVYSQMPLGFELRNQIAIGALEVKRPGRMWISHTLDALSHAELSCLFAGFLLLESPKKGGPGQI